MDIPEKDKVSLENIVEDTGPKINHALEIYLKLKGIGKNKVFHRTAKRNIEYVSRD